MGSRLDTYQVKKGNQSVGLPLVFERYRVAIDDELRLMLTGRHLPMYDMMRYHLGWVDDQGHSLQNSTGKAMRSTLCLLACESTGGDSQKALPAAASVELVHNFSLIHDDIQDNDKERRHRPTVWSIWGKPQAINVGTAMHSLAGIAMLRLGDHGIPVQKQARAQRLLSESSLRMIEGQYLDISYESRLDVGVNEYLEMIERKTAALIACSLELGALLGTDDESCVKYLRNFGRNLGLAFQIRDDILGIWGSEEKTGKPMGSDIQRRKKSFPVVCALENAGEMAKIELNNIYQNRVVDDNDLDVVLEVLDDTQSQVQAQGIAEEYFNRALAELDNLVLSSWAHHRLEEMAYFLVKREF